MKRAMHRAMKRQALMSALGICAALAGGILTAAAQTPQPTPAPAPAPAPTQQHPQQRQPKQKVTLPALAAQGFEVKATVGSYLVMQRGKDVWLCYMLDTRSDCVVAE